MTPRSIRRAAQRKANKRARKAAETTTSPESIFTSEPFTIEPECPIQDATEMAEAPEASAETPRTSPTAAIIPAAAANSGLTATTSVLTGQATLLPLTDFAQYDQLLRGYQTELQPVGLQECNLVQLLAETVWRTRRMVALESAIFAKGRIEFAPQFAEHNPSIRDSLIDVHTFLVYEKQIRGLQLQEARLSRRTDKQSAELRTLQQERRQREKDDQQRQLEAAALLYLAAKQKQQPFHPEENGFVFSNREIESYVAKKQAANQQLSALPNRPRRAEAA